MFAVWTLAGLAMAKNPMCTVPEGRTSVALVTGVEAAAEEARQAALEGREPRPTPTNGLLVVRVDRSDEALAAEWNHVIVVEDGGVELLRYVARRSDGPKDPSMLSEYWTNRLVVPLPSTVRFPAQIHAIDQTAAHECAWTIDARGRAVPL